MSNLDALDAVRLNFSAGSLTLLNAVLAVIMFGVALNLTVTDFGRVVRMPRAFVVGLLGQFLLLPAATYALVLALNPPPSIALGMLLVAACPGGTISNFLTALAGGNAALSVSMSAVSSLAAIVMTPLNLAFWATRYPPTAELLTTVALRPGQVVGVVVLVLALPLALGVALRHQRPGLAARLHPPFRLASILFFLGFVALALHANWDYFLAFFATVATLVVAHNVLAFAVGFATATLARLPDADRRAVTMELGIQNSGLGLLLIFDFLGGLGGAAIIAALWGVWHIVAGVSLATLWRRLPASPAPVAGPAGR